MLNVFNTSFELAESDIDTAVLPMGSLEPKGPHLPLGLDMLLAERFAHDFSAGKAVYLLPSFPFSTAIEARGFRGTVALSQQTLWNVLEDIARFLARHGFKRLVVMDFANHNWILKHAVREMNMDTQILDCVWVNPRQFAREAATADLLPDYGGGAVETSLAMHLFGGLTGEAPADFDPGVPRQYVDYEGFAKVCPEGYWGKPRKATAQLGEEFYELMLSETARYLDYALGLFAKGAPIGAHDTSEVWWPEGEIPGAGAGVMDWHSSLRAIEESGVDTALIVTSSVEQHSPSMPLGTDYFQALEIARRAAEKLGTYLLPALPFVTSWGHAKFRGTVTLRAMTVRQVLEDVVASLYEAGFRRAALINVHGGNWVVKPTLIELNHKYPDMRIVTTGDILSYRGQAPVKDLHADEMEGSFIKAFYPETFKSDKVVDYSPNCTASAFDLVGIGGVTPKGVWGFPSKAAPDTGRTRLEERVDEAVSGIRKAFDDLEDRLGRP